jgi:hypothetical protein
MKKKSYLHRTQDLFPDSRTVGPGITRSSLDTTLLFLVAVLFGNALEKYKFRNS